MLQPHLPNPSLPSSTSQELLLLLDDYWEAHKAELGGIPIYQASSMMSKALGVYQTYVESLNEDIKRVFHVGRDQGGVAVWGEWEMRWDVFCSLQRLMTNPISAVSLLHPMQPHRIATPSSSATSRR